MEVLLILLGWLLGVLSPIIVRQGERSRRQSEISKSLRSELAEFRVRIAMGCHLITTKYGNADRAFFNELLPHLQKYNGTHPVKPLLETIERILTFSDEQIAQTSAALRERDRDKSLSLKKYSLPYLESALSSLDLLDEKTRFLLIEILAQVRTINEEIDQFRYYHQLTFDESLSAGNHTRAKASVADCSLNVAKSGLNVLKKLADADAALSQK